ncbi:MAG: hypothetical protein K6A38_06190 [Lachnospiraceae bacterium]|nr:hypothetical protein [Lachnospiraceae bacterium]
MRMIHHQFIALASPSSIPRLPASAVLVPSIVFISSAFFSSKVFAALTVSATSSADTSEASTSLFDPRTFPFDTVVTAASSPSASEIPETAAAVLSVGAGAISSSASSTAWLTVAVESGRV